ncbi:hypothetical protein PMAYCL1PPCAC_30808, partial [Pristionchus mayeri]
RGSTMRISCSLRSIIRSHHDALDDINAVGAIMRRYAVAGSHQYPANAQPFSISSTQGPTNRSQILREIAVNDSYHRPFLKKPEDLFQRILGHKWDHKWFTHHNVYLGAKDAFASRDEIVRGSRAALEQILHAIKKRNLSLLSDVLLDDGILPEIAMKSGLSSLTKRQLSCLDVSRDDFLGIDGVVDAWRKFDLTEDDPSSLLSSMSIGKSEKHNKKILKYSVDMVAILRKNILIPKALPPPKEKILKAAPRAYGLPNYRMMYATLEFADLATEERGKYSKDPLLLNFHVHSY